MLLEPDEEQTRQLLDRWDVFPGEPARGRRRHKTVIRDSQIRTMVIEYNALATIDRTPEAKMELLRRIYVAASLFFCFISANLCH